MPEVKIVEINKISIAGLIIKRIIDNNLQDDRKYRKISRVDSIINIQAGRMKLQLILNRGDIEVKAGHHPNPTASVSGTLEAIMAMGQKKYHQMPIKFLTGDFKIGGNPMALLPLMGILEM